MNGLALAYIGDAYYELCVRRHLIKRLAHVNALHQEAVRFTSGVAQASIMAYLLDTHMLSETEEALYKKGRNFSGPGRKNIDARTYHMATGFEALIGGLYLDNPTRADALVQAAITYIEEGGS
ncbi:MAG: Mini-ribonuclease 3 [Acholeplasmataceae bacterium]|nr:MAG: Mini-ribonuclease 3 [Acholeplasmataceae bacterium]